MKAVILAGGQGTRMGEETQLRPKPLVEVGGRPIVWHILKLYQHYGFNDFIICAGYAGDMLADHFAREKDENWRVQVVDTGLHTATGGRLKRIRHLLGDETFCMTYGDGVADIDLAALSAAHAAAGATVTMTVVRPELPFGVAMLDGDRVTGFQEKPRADHWINGGFFLCEPGIGAYLAPDAVLERAPLERLAADGQLHGYRHEGFWACMDTYKDAVRLNDLWASGDAPWAN